MQDIEQVISQQIAGLHRTLHRVSEIVKRLGDVQIGSMEDKSEELVDDTRELARETMEMFAQARAFRTVSNLKAE
jgi:N-methylhydantoinase B/oxoprolinase/acetone carboxylase alpha subunit